MTTTQPSPAGWFPDPTGRHELRYWDGTHWAEHVADQGVTATDALDADGSTAVDGDAAPTHVPTGAPTASTSQIMPFQAVEFADVAVRLEPGDARDAIAGILGAHGFQVSFLDPWNAVAERGSRGMNTVFGALAQYYCVGLSVFGGPGGETVVRLLRAPTGYWTGGGLVGKARVSGAFARITNEVIEEFTRRGVLVGVQHA